LKLSSTKNSLNPIKGCYRFESNFWKGNLKLIPALIETSFYAYMRQRNPCRTKAETLGKVKTEQIKHLAKELMTKFPDNFSDNFEENKHTVSALTEGTTTRIRNQVAGYITRVYVLNQQGVPIQEGEFVLEDTEEE
jgi:small subunit ribosomal protein S17e